MLVSVFAVTSGGGLLAASNTDTSALSASLSTYTDVDGTARVYYRQPTDPGVTSHVTASAGNAQAVFSSMSTVVGDTDGNGLLDSWEIAHFGHAGIDSNTDPDGDGLTNLQESQQGSDPSDFFNGEIPVLRSISGERQARASGFLPQPVVSQVCHADGLTPWSNASVTLGVESGTGQWAADSGGPTSSSIELRSDAGGRITAYYWLP